MARTIAILLARFIFAAVFLMAASFKFMGMTDTAAYISAAFLAFAFHGPSRWAGNQTEFGFFVDHFTFLAGPLFAAVHGPGERLTPRIGLIGQANRR